jgi:hypothetical protein
MAVLYLNKSVLRVGPAVPPVVLIKGQAEPPVLPSRTTPFSEESGSMNPRGSQHSMKLVVRTNGSAGRRN